MTKLLIVALTVAFTSPAFALVTPAQVKACADLYRAKKKADDDAAPAGYRVKREKGFYESFIADCLNK